MEDRLKAFLRLSAGLVLLAGLLYLSDPRKVASTVLDAEPLYVAGAAALYLSTYIPVSMRWRNLSSGIGRDLSLRDSFGVISISYGFNQALPGNSGDAVRSKIFQGYQEIDSHSSVLGAVLVERFYDLASVLGIILISMKFIAAGYLGRIYWLLIPFTLAVTGVTAFILFGTDRVERIADHLPERIKGPFLRISQGIEKSSRASTLENISYSAYKWVAEAVIFYMLAVSLGLGVSFWEAAFVTSVMSLVSSLPITPAGVGPVETVGAGLLGAMGLGYSGALSLILVQRSIGVSLTALLGFAVYWADLGGSEIDI
ncbi:MAG: YbhN family protein [Candidatus Nanohaloarchaea archaeon]